MNTRKFIRERVARFYWDEDINCARTVLKILSEYFDITIEDQLHHAALGLHGAGGYRAQCGLVEGTLMFIGVYGISTGHTEERIVEACNCYARQFENTFTSLQCRVLRPQGFRTDNPPHICERLTRDAVLNSITFIERLKKTDNRGFRECA